MKLNNWKFKRDFIKIHTRQSLNCSFVKSSDEEKAFIIDSTSTKFSSINYIVFSSSILYLIIEDLYHKQQTLLAKIEENLTIIETKKIAIIVQKVIESKVDVVVNFKFRAKINFKSFKFEKFTSKFNSSSTSIKSSFVSIIQSDVVLIANLIFISNFSRSIDEIRQVIKSKKLETSNSFFIQSKLQFVASFEFQTKFKFFKFNVFSIDFTLLDVDDIIEFIN